MTQYTLYLLGGLGLFVLAAVWIAYRGGQQTETMADFAIADASLGPYILGLAMASTTISVAVFVGYVGYAYSFGYSVIWLFLGEITILPLGIALFAYRVRKSNVSMKTVSLPDWLGEYYDSQALRVGVALAIFFNLFYIASQFVGGAYIFETLLGWDYQTGLAIIVVLVTSYVLIGATYADIYTDALQAITMIIMGLVLFLSPLWVFDVNVFQIPTYLTNQLAVQNPNLVELINPNSPYFNSIWAILSIFGLIFGLSAQPQVFNKVLALDDPKNVRKMLVTYLLTSISFFLMIFVGIYVRALDPSIQSADQAIYSYIMQFPPLLTAFFGLVILMAALSTTDGLYITISTAIANDIFLKFLVEEGYIDMNRNRADKIAKYLGQIVIVLVGIIGYLIVREPPEYIATLLWVGIAGVISASVAPIMLGIYFPNFVTREGAIASLLFGVSGYIIIAIVIDIGNVFMEGTISLIFSSLIMIFVSGVYGKSIPFSKRT